MGADIVLAVDVSSPIQSKTSLKNMFDVINQAMTLHRGFNPVMIIKMLDDLEKRGDAYSFDGL